MSIGDGKGKRNSGYDIANQGNSSHLLAQAWLAIDYTARGWALSHSFAAVVDSSPGKNGLHLLWRNLRNSIRR
jgi:hypothetical protein